MSLINDALKRAKQTPPGPAPLTPLQPAVSETASATAWLIPTVVIVLVVAAVFVIGFAVAGHQVRASAAVSQPVAIAAPAIVPAPVPVTPPAANPPLASPAPKPAPVIPPEPPHVQAIFYSPTAPTAIMDGKTVRPGDQVMAFRVKAITKNSVSLIGPDQKEIRLDLDN
jgi:hypothetical protein